MSVHVHIIMPCHERPEPEVMLALVRETNDLHEHQIGFSVDSENRMAGPARPRNRGIVNGYDIGATHFLLWDVDNYPLISGAIRTLLASGKDVVGSAIPKRDGSAGIVYSPILDADGTPSLIDDNGIARVSRVGAGFLMLSRSVVDAMRALPDVPSYASDFPQDKGRREWAIFMQGVHEDRWQSDDWGFCVRCERAGIPVHMCTVTRFGHIGKKEFRS